MLRILRNFPWKQAPLVIIGFFVSLVIGAFMDEKKGK